ncbi:hypothetical protein Tdes44962_MAKER09508 [Teratosphaeria destructans]|uniref:Uncharacterized protein n=1 Tax=Teratosphaeria destructans TaxID=418781 RepID=A0A9W7ST29_9PEZI|nr:hypothetical protein Tdes44962_MAKER09508 [Teratosphaeria destructans]
MSSYEWRESNLAREEKGPAEMGWNFGRCVLLMDKDMAFSIIKRRMCAQILEDAISIGPYCTYRLVPVAMVVSWIRDGSTKFLKPSAGVSRQEVFFDVCMRNLSIRETGEASQGRPTVMV